jgi:hypothetical protein
MYLKKKEVNQSYIRCHFLGVLIIILIIVPVQMVIGFQTQNVTNQIKIKSDIIFKRPYHTSNPLPI